MNTPRLRSVNYRAPDGMASPTGLTPPDTVVYAIGDIHGRYDLLETIQRGIAFDARMRRAQRKVIVYLGDYLSRGHDSRRAVERVLEWRPGDCGQVEIVALKGNHEDLALRFLGGELAAGRHWFDYDGLDALRHYGVPVDDGAPRDDAAVQRLRERFAEAMPAPHLEFFRSLKASHREGGYHFVHAGVRPGVALAEQGEHDQMWIRTRFLESGADHGATVIHGHSSASEPQVRHNRIGIDTGAYATGVLTCLVLDGGERAFLQT